MPATAADAARILWTRAREKQAGQTLPLNGGIRLDPKQLPALLKSMSQKAQSRIMPFSAGRTPGEKKASSPWTPLLGAAAGGGLGYLASRKNKLRNALIGAGIGAGAGVAGNGLYDAHQRQQQIDALAAKIVKEQEQTAAATAAQARELGQKVYGRSMGDGAMRAEAVLPIAREGLSAAGKAVGAGARAGTQAVGTVAMKSPRIAAGVGRVATALREAEPLLLATLHKGVANPAVQEISRSGLPLPKVAPAAGSWLSKLPGVKATSKALTAMKILPDASRMTTLTGRTLGSKIPAIGTAIGLGLDAKDYATRGFGVVQKEVNDINRSDLSYGHKVLYNAGRIAPTIIGAAGDIGTLGKRLGEQVTDGNSIVKRDFRIGNQFNAMGGSNPSFQMFRDVGSGGFRFRNTGTGQVHMPSDPAVLNYKKSLGFTDL